MAPVVGFLGKVVAVGKTIWGAKGVVGFLIRSTALTAASYGANRLLSKKARASDSSLTSGSPFTMSREPAAPRRLIYGERRVSGPLVFAHVSGSANEYLHLVIPLAGHEVNAIPTIYFNDEVVPLDGSGNATGTYGGFARVKKFLGIAAGERDTDLETESGGLWTEDHLGKFVARIHVRLKWDQSKFPGGVPNISAVVQGKKVYDPRTDTTAYSKNPALCMRDFLLIPEGWGGPGWTVDDIDDDAVIESANICDEPIPLAE